MRLQSVTTLRRTCIGRALALILLATGCDQGVADDEAACIDTNCANYTSREAAQAAFEAEPECRSDLDADEDGLACEEPGNSVKTCGSSSNCGCSGLRKDACPSNPCCRWIVGYGCGCR